MKTLAAPQAAAAAAEVQPSDRAIMDAAARLRAVYGMTIRISFNARAEPCFATGHTEEFWISGGNHSQPRGPKSNVHATGTTLAEAEQEFIRQREELAKIDPVQSLRDEAAKHGLDLVPAGRPLDLESSTNREG